MRKPQRSTHIHNCRRKQLACTLERLQSELGYCFACFDWFVEEEWGQHCQTHLQSITSKRCGSITHCHTLFRPAFCPYCMGDNRLPASSRWTSWTREAKLWSHLELHLESSRWPLECPHPLCSLQLDDETLFLYHLSDVHSLRMSPNVKRCQTERNSKPLNNWKPTVVSHKRKKQDTDGPDLQPLKRTKGSLQIKWDNERSPDQSLDRGTADQAQAMLSSESFKASITQAATHNHDLRDLPELTYSESMSPPDTDELHSFDALGLSQDVLQRELHSELRWSMDLPETHTHEHKSPLPVKDALFSQYLRSRSPSCFSAQGIGENYNNNGKIQSQSMTLGGTSSSSEDSIPAGLIDQDPVKPENALSKTNKPRITLRIRPPKPESKPKVLLRLSQPKKAPAQVPQGSRSRRKRQT